MPRRNAAAKQGKNKEMEEETEQEAEQEQEQEHEQEAEQEPQRQHRQLLGKVVPGVAKTRYKADPVTKIPAIKGVSWHDMGVHL